jgi:hypothetical protein
MKAVSIKTIGDWNAKVGVMLDQALQVSVDVFRRSAGQACKHAVILMAQSLASKRNALTPSSKVRRKVQYDSKGVPFVEVWNQAERTPRKVYKWFFKDDESKWEAVKIIKNRGLAQKSWMWGLGQWGAPQTTKPISGLSEVLYRESREKVEAIKRNKLPYIEKIVSSSAIEQASQRASNKIMAQAARKMESQWKRSLKGRNSMLARSVSSYFLPEATTT